MSTNNTEATATTHLDSLLLSTNNTEATATTSEEDNTMSTNNTEATATAPTWGDVWDKAYDASEATAASAVDWAKENPKTAAATAVAVGIGIGYLFFG